MLAFLVFTIAAGPLLTSAYPNGIPPNIVQQLLNDICRQNSSVEGCSDIYSERPSSCVRTEKRCPQKPARCFERNFNCNILDLTVVCQVDPDLGIAVQPLVCGDGTRIGELCGNNIKMPVYTVIAAYCEGINDINTPIGASLGVANQAGNRGGSGIYSCSEEGTWVPNYNSPTIEELSLSCRRAVCGSVPQPSRTLQVQRKWPMVRALKKGEALHCSAAIVSKNAALTAAHCVTSSESSEEPDKPQKYELEIPGPLGNSIDIQLDLIKLHPGYKYNYGSPIFDLAVIFFTTRYKVPTLCMATEPISSSHSRTQVGFGLRERISREKLKWDVFEASKDDTCNVLADRSVLCEDDLTVGKSQYCVRQDETIVRKGSSGGPHLIEIGDGVKETWAVQGILSRYSNQSSCHHGRLIYIDLKEASTWLQNCVFNQQCT